MMMYRYACLAACLLALAGCDDKKQAVELSDDVPTENFDNTAANTPDAGAADAGAEAPAEATSYYRKVTLVGSPFDDQNQVLYIKYIGEGDEPTSLVRAYGSDRVAGKFLPKTDAKLEIKKSMLTVVKSRPLKVKGDKLRLPGTTFNDKKQKFGADQVIELKKGETVHLLKYAAEGTCFVGYEGFIYNMTCPTPVEFEADGWDGSPTPIEYEWWILTSEGATRGWLKIDGKDFIHEVDKKATKRLRKKKKRKR